MTRGWKILTIFLQMAFIAGLLGVVVTHKLQKPRILFVHSYNIDYQWVVAQNGGTTRILGKDPSVTSRYYYLDLKNHPDKDFERTATGTLMRTIAEWQPDVLVLFDDAAQRLVGAQFLDHPKISIVFAGVNGTPQQYGYDKASNVTGILERKPTAAIRETAMMVARSKGFDLSDPSKPKPRMVWIADMSESVSADLSYLDKVDWSPIVWLPPKRVADFAAWKAAVAQADREADIVFVSDYSEIHEKPGEPVLVRPLSRIMSWTEEHSANPVIGGSSTMVADGGMLQVAASGAEQGVVAAERARALAKKQKKPQDWPVASTHQFVIGMRKTVIEQRKLTFPIIYEAFSREENNYYE